MRVDLDGLDGRGVAGVDDPAARSVLADDLLGRDAVDGLAALEAAEVGAFGDAEAPRGLDVEAARAVVLDERVAERLDAVLDGEARDDEAVEADLLVGLELDHVERVAGAADDGPHDLLEERGQARRAEELQRPRRGRACRRS